MKKPFDTLFVNLEKSLKTLDRELSAADRYSRGVVMIREKILQMRALAKKFITGRETEVEFFRRVWPAFYGRLLLYIKLHHFEVCRLSIPVTALPALIRREEKRVATFFRVNREFWMYYRDGSGSLDEQFTRAYSQSRIYDPLALVIDLDGATLGSYRAAWCWAMEAYRAWLEEEKERVMAPAGPEPGSDYSWAPTDADYVEWLNGLFAVKAIRYKGTQADLNRLIKWGRWALGKEISNIYDRFKVIRNRKKERLVFTKRTAGALEKRMDEAEGKFE